MANQYDLTGTHVKDNYNRLVQVTGATGPTQAYYDGLGNLLTIGATGLTFNGNRTVTRIGVPLLNVGGSDVVSWLNNYFFPSVAPTITIGSFTNKELGTTYTPTITGTITPNDGIITDRIIKRGATIINHPAGNSISFTDGGQTNSVTYTNEVDTSNFSPVTASTTINFYAPVWYGVGAVGLTSTQIQGLTKIIQGTKVSANLVFNPVLQRYYYAYPSALGTLTSIIDQNGFNITGAFNLTTANFLLADSVTVVNYNIYTSNANTTQTNFTISFN